VGTGLAFYEIVKRNPDGINIGIDISEGMLKKAQKRMRKIKSANYELKIGSAFEIPYPDGSFDLLINNYMFDLISFDDMEKILIEFRRVLKKGGKLILVNMTMGEKLGSRIYELIYRLSPKLIGGCRPVKMSDKLNATGFHVITREYHQQLLFPSEVILAEKKS
jgi:ubiquinone/menaquinone biosynthesis C-methylase UbiE